MNPVANTAGSIRSRFQNLTIVAKIKMWLSAMLAKLKERFNFAKSKFKDVMDAELRIQGVASVRANEQELRKLDAVVCGFLISPVTEKAFPLYEGSNYFSLENGMLSQVLGVSSGSNLDYKIRVENDQIELDNLKDVGRLLSFTSNENVSLGGESFVLKLLPNPYRLAKDLYVSAPEEKK